MPSVSPPRPHYHLPHLNMHSPASGQRVSVIASGSIGANTITISSGKIFEGCGTINVANRAGHGAIEVLNAQGVQIPYLTMTGSPYFGLRFYGTKDLTLGKITMNLSGGLGSEAFPPPIYL